MDNDYELLKLWRSGDRQAGDRLLRRHVASLHRFFRNKVDREVDDLTQRTFLECIKAKDKFEGRASFKTLLFVVARRQLFRFYEKAAKADVSDIGSMSIIDLQTSPSQLAARRKEHALLLSALRRIPLELQITVELHYWEDLTTAELAEVLDIPQGTVKSRLRRAREALAQALHGIEKNPTELESTLGDLEGWARSLREVVNQA